jgi:hypothetical protein
MKIGQDIDAPWTTYTPALQALTIGTTGGQYLFGRYKRLGKIVVVEAGFRFGTDGVLSGSPNIGIGLPSNANFASGVQEYLFGARKFTITDGSNWGGIGAVVASDPDMVINFATGGTTGWTIGVPTPGTPARPAMA